PVSNRVPEIEHPMRPRTDKAGPVHHVGLTALKRTQEQVIVTGIVFQVRILDDDVIARGFADPAPQGRSLSHIARLQEDLDLCMLLAEFSQNLSRAIVGPVVYAQKFDGGVHGENTTDDSSHGRLLVVNWHHYGNFHAVAAQITILPARCRVRLVKPGGPL